MASGSRDERKRRVAEAAWRIIAEQGITNVSVRTVAAEAGMAVGSLRHLFPTQDKLLEFSAELMVQQVTDRVEALVSEGDADVIAHAERIIAELIPLTALTRREFELNLALIVQAPATARLAEIRDRAHQSLSDLFQRIAATVSTETQDSPTTEHRGRRLHALIDGLGLHLLHQEPDADTTWARGLIREELTCMRHAHANQQSPRSTTLGTHRRTVSITHVPEDADHE